MKLIYDEGEKERLRERYEQFPEARLFNGDPDHTYSISFKITDPAIAGYILFGLLHDRLKDFDIGIDVRTVHFAAVPDKQDLKQKLHQMIDEVVDNS